MLLIIPFDIPTQNETERGRTHYVRAAKTARRRAMWRLACQSEMVRTGLRPATGKRRLHITTYKARRCDDIANVIGGGKACVDGLVDAGLLTDDADREACITYGQGVASKSPTGRTCTVLDVSDETA
jgi:hypothetical protein